MKVAVVTFMTGHVLDIIAIMSFTYLVFSSFSSYRFKCCTAENPFSYFFTNLVHGVYLLLVHNHFTAMCRRVLPGRLTNCIQYPFLTTSPEGTPCGGSFRAAPRIVVAPRRQMESQNQCRTELGQPPFLS